MNFLISVVLLLMMMGVFLCALFYVVRTAVKEGMQMALRMNLLDQRALGNTDVCWVSLCAVSNVCERAVRPHASSTARTAASGRACPDEEQTGSDGARAGEVSLGARTGAGAITL